MSSLLAIGGNELSEGTLRSSESESTASSFLWAGERLPLLSPAGNLSSLLSVLEEDVPIDEDDTAFGAKGSSRDEADEEEEEDDFETVRNFF